MNAIQEIVLEPTHFKYISLAVAAGELVHLMVLVWQASCGKTSRRGYRNRDWAKKMNEIGLRPTADGTGAGKQTGQSLTQIIVEGGEFQRALEELSKSGFFIPWFSNPPPERTPSAGKRWKYACAGCKANVWGKAGLSIQCKNCSSDGADVSDFIQV